MCSRLLLLQLLQGGGGTAAARAKGVAVLQYSTAGTATRHSGVASVTAFWGLCGTHRLSAPAPEPSCSSRKCFAKSLSFAGNMLSPPPVTAAAAAPRIAGGREAGWLCSASKCDTGPVTSAGMT